jgi:hypothetical protein
MFRPPSLLAPLIVPTAANTAAGQLGLLRPGLSCFVASARSGYANRPKTGNWRYGDLHPARLSALSAAPITPLRHYYEAVRPSPAHRYFWPRGFSACALYGLFVVKRFQSSDLFFLLSSSVSLFDLESRFFAPTHSIARPARAGAVKVGRRTDLSKCSALARPMP